MPHGNAAISNTDVISGRTLELEHIKSWKGFSLDMFEEPVTQVNTNRLQIGLKLSPSFLGNIGTKIKFVLGIIKLRGQKDSVKLSKVLILVI